MTFSLKNFVGGINNRSEELAPNESSDCMNMQFYDETVIDNRFGQKYYDELVLDDEVLFIDEFKPYKENDVLLRATKGKLYHNSDIITTIAGKPCGVNHDGKYFFTDGSTLWVYGKFGQITTTFEKIIGTAINDFCLMQIVNPSTGHPRLDTSFVQGVLNIDYGNYQIYYEPCENEFVDTFSGANVLPESTKFIISHNGRLFVSGSDKDNDNIFITDLHNPYYFPVTLPIQLPPNSDRVIGMCVYDSAVVVGRQDDIYAIYGMTNRVSMGVDVFQLKKLNSHTGFANMDAVKVAHNYLFFLGSDGNAYSMSSARTDYKTLSTIIITKNLDIRKEPVNLLIDDVVTATSFFHDDLWYLSIKDKVLVYSYRLQKWTIYNGLNARSFYVMNHELIWGNTSGRTITWDKENFLDFGLPYESYWYSKQFDMEDSNTFKQFRDFFLVAHTFNDYSSNINVLFELDYVDVKDRVVVSNHISLWGKAKWGDRYITRNIVESLPFTLGRRARNIRFKLSCGYYLHGEVSSILDLDGYVGKKDGLLVKVTGQDSYYVFFNREWNHLTLADLNQRMRVYQINGDYEFRGKR